LMELSDQLLASLDCSSEQVLALLRGYGYRVLNVNLLDGALTSPFDGTILALPEILEKAN